MRVCVAGWLVGLALGCVPSCVLSCLRVLFAEIVDTSVTRLQRNALWERKGWRTTPTGRRTVSPRRRRPPAKHTRTWRPRARRRKFRPRARRRQLYEGYCAMTYQKAPRAACATLSQTSESSAAWKRPACSTTSACVLYTTLALETPLCHSSTRCRCSRCRLPILPSLRDHLREPTSAARPPLCSSTCARRSSCSAGPRRRGRARTQPRVSRTRATPAARRMRNAVR